MVELSHRVEDGERLGALLWEFGPGWRMISSAMLGGGIGPREWVLNAQVVAGYSRMDPVEHLTELAPPGDGVGMMTAAFVEKYARASDGGVEAVATVGLRVPTWAAAPEGVEDQELRPIRVGTINIIVAVPVAMSDAALVNTVMTVTEAKAQALVEVGFPGTGTASDAVCIAVRDRMAGEGNVRGRMAGDANVRGRMADGGNVRDRMAEGVPDVRDRMAAGGGDAAAEELFGGPRSEWGARIARAVHAAVLAGAKEWYAYK
ncbi:adenosylcobinamide amidohydrolase [Nonomuraea sp. NPDC050556]|uniref:adenosylcobinamide amidohydrolase n=1 Tax=Nonomuraea sp. NPDC050556 TaxID=3364369 RepID=UPI0037959756